MEVVTPVYEETFGFIHVVKKDGSDGGCCPILGDTTFGRDKESDIRIKLPQVSKHQAVIKVDENGKAFITNLSKTNPTIVNGNSIEDIEISYLTHGDEILIGERQFLYQSSAKRSDISSNTKLVMKQVPKTEPLDEAMTTNFSELKGSVLQDQSNVLTTIPESAEEASEEIKAPVVEKKKTPMKAASPIPIKHKTPAKSPKTSMNSIFNEIKARRKSGPGPLAISQESQVAKSPIRVPASKKSMITPLRNAIEARRFTGGTPSNNSAVKSSATPLSQQKTTDRRMSGCAAEFKKSVEAPALLPENTITEVKETAPTPASAVATPVEATAPKEESFVRPNKSSLLREIEARRKSYGASKTPSKTLKTPTKINSAIKSKTPAKSPAVPMVAKAVVATLMEQIVAQRKKTPCKSARKSIGAIRAESSKKNSVKKSATKKVATPPEEPEAEMEVVLPNDNIEEASTRVSLSKGEVIAASCTQLSVDALAVKLEMGGNEASAAYETAVGAFLGNPIDFTPEETESTPVVEPSVETTVNPATPKSSRKSISTLQSSLKKAGASSAVKSNVVANMTEQELDLIDAYATQIEVNSEGAIDKNESYAVAMDSFIRGVEQTDTTIPKDKSAFYGASLANLFKEEGEDDDQALIASYAAELQDAACIDTAVAYGIALDTYLSDPIIFRERLKVKDESVEDTVVKQETDEMIVGVGVECASLNITSEVFDAASPVKSVKKTAKKSSVKKSAKKSATKKVSNTPLTMLGENSIFSPAAQGSPFVKAASAVKDAVSAVWETIVASPVRAARQSIGEILGSPRNVEPFTEAEKVPEISKDADKAEEPMEVEVIAKTETKIETETAPVEKPATIDDSIEAKKVIPTPKKSPRKSINKTATPKSVKKTPTSVKKSAAKNVISAAPVEIVEQDCVQETIQEEIISTIEVEAAVEEVAVKEKSKRGSRAKKTAPASAPASAPAPTPAAVAKKNSKNAAPVVAEEVVEEKEEELVVESKSTRVSKRKAVAEPIVENAPVEEIKKGGNKKSKKENEEAIVEDVIVEEKPTRGRRTKNATPAPVPAPASKKGPKKAAPVVAEEVVEEEEALVLICDGCETEFFYDELYPDGDFEIPEGDWFCTPCELHKKSTKCTKATAKKAASVKKATAPVKGKKTAAAAVEEAPKRSSRRK